MDMQREKNQQMLHLSMRKHLDVSGVTEVIRFDDICVILQTVCGELTIDGKDLKMSVMDKEKGIVTLDGQVDAMYYLDENKKEKRGFFGRVFA